jgi:MFS transporter, SP family, solute carrier family 2 (myo-inositol transporter), member 13
MYFSATIFSLVGFRSPTLTSLSVAITNFLFTLAAFHLIDRVGRRRILLLSIPFMVLGLAACAFAFQFVPLTQSDDSKKDHDDPMVGGPWPMILLLSMVLYVAAYAIGLGNVPWQQSELFALPVRAMGSALSTATNWTANFVVGLTFLPMLLILGPVLTFGIYAIVCLGGLVLVHRIYPETAGLSLEEVGGLLAHGWGVQESISRWKAARSA